MYYSDKIARLRRLFGTDDIAINADRLVVNGAEYRIVDDVIICLKAEKWPASVRAALGDTELRTSEAPFAEDIQFTFGEEWKSFSEILPEHRQEFADYFDIVDLTSLTGKEACDLGCGIGRWSSFLASHTQRLTLVDFSDAIFVARRNLAFDKEAIFVMADILDLPFAADAFDFLLCLGVLHHLPADPLQQVVKLGALSPQLLVYLYYALDNRPAFYRGLLAGVTVVRQGFSRIRGGPAREMITTLLTVSVYLPLVLIGRAVAPLGMGRFIPLYEGYRGKSIKRTRQDVYDRFFTRIEQRVTRNEILALTKHFAQVEVSPRIPYWHFLCCR